MNDDEGFEEEGYLDDEYDAYEEEVQEERAQKKRILNRKSEEDYEPQQEAPSQAAQERAPQPKPKAKASKISPIRSNNRRGGGMEVCVIKPKSMEDSCEITETLLADCTVVLNMEGLDLDVAQRIIDFACGSCFAIHGNLQKISNYIFILTPQSVDISGDFQEILSGAFDVPSFGTRF